MEDPVTKSLAELNEILKKNKRPTVVLFATPGLGITKKLKPAFETLPKASGVSSLFVDVDNNQEAKKKYGIGSLPTWKVLDASGNTLMTAVGAAEKVIKDCINFAKSAP